MQPTANLTCCMLLTVLASQLGSAEIAGLDIAGLDN